MKTIGFLGAGNMAEALIRGLLRGHFEASQITASGPRQERMAELGERFGINATTDNRQPAAADIVILSVKPQILSRVLDEVGGLIRADALVISIAAGVPIAAIQARLVDLLAPFGRHGAESADHDAEAGKIGKAAHCIEHDQP